jgi:hypothetical protein
MDIKAHPAIMARAGRVMAPYSFASAKAPVDPAGLFLAFRFLTARLDIFFILALALRWAFVLALAVAVLSNGVDRREAAAIRRCSPWDFLGFLQGSHRI